MTRALRPVSALTRAACTGTWAALADRAVVRVLERVADEVLQQLLEECAIRGDRQRAVPEAQLDLARTRD
jgi:hypothetical protein